MIVNIPPQTKGEKRQLMTYDVEECKNGLNP